MQVKYTRDSYREDYINGESFQTRKNRHKTRFPKSYYCFVCDCKRMLDWHHVDYTKLGKEDFFRDGWWMCDPLCPCKRNCHFRAHRKEDGLRIVLARPLLEARRKQLRSKYVKAYVKPSTIIAYLATWLYRLFW